MPVTAASSVMPTTGPAGGQDTHPGAISDASRLVQQAGLADPGGALDYKEAPGARASVLECGLQLAELGLSLEQRGLAPRDVVSPLPPRRLSRGLGSVASRPASRSIGP